MAIVARAARKITDLLGLTVGKDLDTKLETASREEMEEWHKAKSYTKGVAGMGVAVNGLLGLLSPTNLVSYLYNVRQYRLARDEMKEIEAAAKARFNADFRRGGERVSRKRHVTKGVVWKAFLSVLTLGQDDVIMAMTGWHY